MKEYRKILAGVDFSKVTDQVVLNAASMALKFGSELYLINVINRREIDSIHYVFQKLKFLTDKVSVESLIEKLRKDREKKINELLKLTYMNLVPNHCLIRTGEPAEEIIAEAKEIQADLIIVGDKGRTSLAEAMVGSTTQKLLRHSPVSLVVIRKGQSGENRG